MFQEELVDTYIEQGQFVKAAEVLSTLLSMKPDDEGLLVKQAKIYAKQGLDSKAVINLQQVLHAVQHEQEGLPLQVVKKLLPGIAGTVESEVEGAGDGRNQRVSLAHQRQGDIVDPLWEPGSVSGGLG